MENYQTNTEDDPQRCQAVTAEGQCTILSEKDSDFCRCHGGVPSKQKALKNYYLNKWQTRLEEKKNSPNIKSLRDEVGILRIMLEERLNQCFTEMDLILYSQPISELVMKIDKVVTSCHRLEGAMGQLLDKQAILQFAAEVISIIGEVLKGQDDKISEIATKMTERLGANE